MRQVFFLGQAPARPSSKHDIPGTYLHKWLHSIGFSNEEILQSCHFYALMAEFPGATPSGHLAPSHLQIESHRPVLMAAIQTIQPEIIVPVGKMAIAEILQTQAPLNDTIGKTFQTNPFGVLHKTIPCIPLSHPSGRSVWNHTHITQVQHALDLLRAATA